MASFSTIRDQIKARLDTIPGLSTYDLIPTSVNVPAALVGPETGTFLSFDTTMSRGSDDLQFKIVLVVQTADDTLAQDALDVYLAGSGASSVKATVDGNLGGTANFAVVTEARNYGIHTVGSVDYYGCEFALTVGVT